MDFGALPPEINSGLMYAGSGSSTLISAATAWDGLASQLQSAATSFDTVVANLTGGPWQGPSSTTMAAATAPYIAWMNTTASQAEQAAGQARSAAAAYQAAFSMTVPPAVVAANRAQLLTLVATNFFGQNTAAIAANEAQYAEMWAQDATAMYNYAANATTASSFTAFTAPADVTNTAGVANQTSAVSAATSTGTSQSSISQLITNALQSLTTPAASTSSNSTLTDLLNALGLGGTGTTTATGTTNPLTGAIDGGSVLNSLIAEYGDLPGFFGIMMGSNAIAPMLYTGISQAMTAAPAAAAGGAAAGAAQGAATAAGSALGPAAGTWGSVGEAAALGRLSVPQNWLWSAAQPLDMVAPAGVPILMPEGPVGAPGAPMVLGGLPRAAGIGAAAGAGAAAVKYGTRNRVMARPPAAGYSTDEEPRVEPAASNASSNGHAPAGYRPAIVYVPANGHVPANN